MSIEARYADGQLAALARLKLAFPAPTHPVVQQSATLRAKPSTPMSSQAQERLQPPTTPFSVSQRFDAAEQTHTRSEPMRKLSAEGMCTTCRKARHYGSCTRPIPIKRADFNAGLTGGDPAAGDNPSTSPHYHSATSDSALARSRDDRPADEQAATYFADLFRHQGQVNLSDEPGRMSGGLNKVATHPLLLAAGAKIMGANILHRHGASIPPLRWLGKEIAGIGARTAMQGKPMLSRPLRELFSATVDPSMVGLYEHAHGLGQRIQPNQVPDFRQALQHPAIPAAARQIPGLAQGAQFAASVPLESKGIRRAIDYGFTPVGQVWQDVKSGIGGLFRRPTGSMATAKAAGWQLWGTDGHSTHEDRGPANPYEERLTRKSPPIGFGDEGPQRIRRAFDQVDGAVDTTNIGGGFGEPTGGPAALG